MCIIHSIEYALVGYCYGKKNNIYKKARCINPSKWGYNLIKIKIAKKKKKYIVKSYIIYLIDSKMKSSQSKGPYDKMYTINYEKHNNTLQQNIALFFELRNIFFHLHLI